MDSSYISPHLDVSMTPLQRAHTHTHSHTQGYARIRICLSVKHEQWATGTVLLKPLVTLGNAAHARHTLSHMPTPLATC